MTIVHRFPTQTCCNPPICASMPVNCNTEWSEMVSKRKTKPSAMHQAVCKNPRAQISSIPIWKGMCVQHEASYIEGQKASSNVPVQTSIIQAVVMTIQGSTLWTDEVVSNADFLTYQHNRQITPCRIGLYRRTMKEPLARSCNQQRAIYRDLATGKYSSNPNVQP